MSHDSVTALKDSRIMT